MENVADLVVVKFLAVLLLRMHTWHLLFSSTVLEKTVLRKTRKI